MKKALLFSVAVVLLLGYCSISSSPPRPCRVGILQELSRAAPRKGIPMLGETDFNSLVETVSRTGGEIGFGSITTRDLPLARLRIPRLNNAYQKRTLERRVEAFREQVVKRLSVQLADRLDPTFALGRVDTFFHEAERNARQYLIYVGGVSDSSSPPPQLSTAGIHVLVVAGPGYRPRIRNAIYFESVAAAIDYIRDDSEETNNDKRESDSD